MTAPVTETMVAVPTKRTPFWRAPGFVRPVALFALAIVALIIGGIISPGLPSWGVAESIVTQSLFLAVLAFGQGLVMLIGGFDLSIPGVVGLSATIVALGTSAWGWNFWVAILIALVASAAAGFVNGYLVSQFKIPAFIITLAMSGVLMGITIGIGFGRQAPPSPSELVHLFSGAGKMFGIGIPVVVFIIVGVLGWLIQARSRYGRGVYLFGSSPRTARLSGLPAMRTEISVYMASSLAAGVGGLMLLGFSGNAQPALGQTWLMPAIAAVLVGGTIIGSGYGFWQATLMSAVLLTTISIVIGATGLSSGLKNVLYGAVVLIALVVMSKENNLGSKIKSAFKKRNTDELAEG